MTTAGLHETLSHSVEAKAGSDRSFGLVVGGALILVGVAPLRHHGEIRLWAVAAGIVLAVVGLVAPRLLAPMNLLWFRLGMLLGRVMTPVIMGLLFVTTIIPIGLIMQMTGHDTLRLRRPAKAESFWLKRQPPGPLPETMRDQF
jgi:hypothetical protein